MLNCNFPDLSVSSEGSVHVACLHPASCTRPGPWQSLYNCVRENNEARRGREKEAGRKEKEEEEGGSREGDVLFVMSLPFLKSDKGAQ